MTIQTYPAPKSQVTSSFWRYTATGGETTLTGIDNAGVQLAYLPGQEQFFLNGVMLMRGTDYTATNGTSIVGLSALTASDYVQVITYSNFTVTNIPVGSISGAITNLQLANSTFTLGSTLINLGDTKNTIAGLTLTSPTINNPIVGTQYSTSVPLTVKGAAGQAVSLQEWQDSSSNVKAYISSAGNINTSGSLTIGNNNNSGTSYRINLAGTDTNHSIYSTGSNSNNMYFNEYGNFYFYNTQYSLEYMRIDPNGSTIFGGLDPNTYNPSSTYNRTLSVRQSDQVLTLGSYWQAGVGQNSYINSSQSTSATNASNLFLQTGQITRMIIDTSGNVGIGMTPSTKLDVAGSTRAQGFGSTNATFSLTTGAAAYNFGRSGLILVQGGIASNNFWDLVLQQQYGGLVVLGSAVYGSPSTRSYTTGTGGTLQVSLSGGTSGTYVIGFSQFAAS